MRQAPDSPTPIPPEPASRPGRLLVVDDEAGLVEVLVETLTQAGYRAEGFTSGKAALAALREREFDAVLTDLMMPGLDGMALLRAGLEIDPDLVGLVMTGQGTVQTAVEAMKAGAFDYVLKPFKLQAILPVLTRALEWRRLRLENVQLREAVALYDLSQAIAFTLDAHAIAEKTAQAVFQQSDGDEVSVLLLTPAGDELYVAAVRGENRAGLLGTRVPVGEGVAGWLAQHGEPLILNGAVNDPRFTPLYPRADISSALALPMLTAGKVLGVLTINALRRRRPYTQGQVKALSILANTAAAALENVTLYTALRASEGQYRELVEQASDGISLADPQGHYVEVNSKMCEMLGYSREELLRLPLRDIVTSEDLARAPLHFDDLRAGKVVLTERQWRRKDGTVLPVEISLKMLSNGNFQAISRDITERKRAEEALAHEQYRMRTLMDNIPDAIYFKDGHSRFTRVNNALAIKHHLDDPEQAVGKSDFDFFAPESAQAYYDEEQVIIQTNQPVVGLEEQELWPDRPPTWASTTKMPLRDQAGHVVGTFGISRDITERKQRERELEAIARVSAALRTALTRAEMPPVILDQLMIILDAEAAILVKVDPPTSEGVVELARGGWASQSGERIPPGRGIHGRVQVTGQPYLTNDLPGDAFGTQDEAAGGVRTLLAAPLIAHGQTIGVIGVGRQTPLADSDMRLLTSITDMAANALQRATLYEQTQRRVEQLQALRTIDAAIIGSFDMQLTLRVLLNQARAHLRADAAGVLLLDPHTHTLSYASASGFRSQAVQQTHLGAGDAQRAVLERKPVRIPNLTEAAQEFGRAELLAEERFTAYYGMPLVAKGQVKGVLEIFHRAPLNPDQDWLDFLETLAGQAAIAIDNAELFDDLQRSNAGLALAYDTTLEGWSRALDMRDKETEGHTRRVTEMTVRLAHQVGMTEAELVHVRRGALLHDIGKMGIPDAILLKPGPLTDDEGVIMRQHPTYAFELLSPIAYLRPALDIPYCHHEKWDGTGYPRGLQGEQIPLAARLFAAVDVWDALRSDRPYRAAWPDEQVRQHIRSLAGTHLEPKAVEAFLAMTG